MAGFKCSNCEKEFTIKSNLYRHIRNYHSNQENLMDPQSSKSNRFTFTDEHFIKNCQICNREFLNEFQLNQHLKTHSVEKICTCPKCGKKFAKGKSVKLHLKNCGANNNTERKNEPVINHTLQMEGGGGEAEESETDEGSFIEIDSALNYNAAVFQKGFNSKSSIEDLKNTLINKACLKIQQELAKHGNLKYYFTLELIYHKAVNQEVLTDPPIFFNSEVYRLYEGDREMVLLQCQVTFNSLMQQMEEFSQNGSGKKIILLYNIFTSFLLYISFYKIENLLHTKLYHYIQNTYNKNYLQMYYKIIFIFFIGWVVNRLLNLNINMVSYDPLHAGTYIPLPEKFKNPNQGISNFLNFLYCLYYLIYCFLLIF